MGIITDADHPEDIPAATQLFTPNWIVRYLVENSLGRLWMLNNPNSKLIDKMDYYIKTQQEETDFLKVSSPEEIKICDPACGSGHMLVYAFDILYLIYEEEGYEVPEIPQLILQKNLFGIEIDERAGELAAFALFMNARQKYRRFFRKSVKPNICVLENINFESNEVKNYMDKVNPNLFTMKLQTLLYQFNEADNFGSLIRPELTNIPNVLNLLDEKKVSDDMFLQGIHQRVLKVLKQADYLSPKYHVVITNPPYMGSGSMNGRLGKWVKDNYPASKADLFATFIDRNLTMVMPKGIVAMITMQSWMFLSSYKKLRSRILDQYTIRSMAHIGTRGFDSIGGEVVSTTAFIIGKINQIEYKGSYLRLITGNSEKDKLTLMLECIRNPNCNYLFYSSTLDFKTIPAFPIAYWVSDGLREAFRNFLPFSNFAETRIGLITGENNYYIRQWQEVSISKIGFNLTRDEAALSKLKWFPQSKGGDFRKWYGNNNTILNWEKDGNELQTRIHSSGKRVLAHNFNLDKIFLSGLTWTKIASGTFGARIQPKGFLFNDASANAFPAEEKLTLPLLAFLCSKLPSIILEAINPTLNFLPGNISSLPISAKLIDNETIKNNTLKLIHHYRQDWDSYETSWDYSKPAILDNNFQNEKLEVAYITLRIYWREKVRETQLLETENNKIFIEEYGLMEEIEAKTPLSEVTLLCNPIYRYGEKKTEQELEKLLLTDTLKEFISYSVGCMFGRYSLDISGLILANQGQTMDDYLVRIREPSFKADEDNVIPIMDVDWFADDITDRFKKFLKVAFGEEKYEENIAFIENAIGKDIRKYFIKDFYTEHLKMYKKRPIYWMFSSPKGNFNALIYMHRYKPDTVSIVLNDYLREFRTKLAARNDHLENISISTSASQTEKTKALKDIEKIKKVLDEVNEYERNILYPLATKQKKIDLDDGVKVNYPKFGNALKKIAGLRN